MKKKASKKVTIIVISIALVFLLFPIERFYKDGGTRTYDAVLYNVTIYKRMTTSFPDMNPAFLERYNLEGEFEGYIAGTVVTVLGFIEVFNNTRFEPQDLGILAKRRAAETE